MAERDFEELLGLFSKHRVRYCIVGAYAVAFHAIPRYTKDMDILVEPSITNGARILRALREFGFGLLRLSAEDFGRTGRVIQLGHEPVRVDLVTSVDGCTFEQVWKGKAYGSYGARRRVPFIGFRELIRNKRATGRPLDRIDLEKLLGVLGRKRR